MKEPPAIALGAALLALLPACARSARVAQPPRPRSAVLVVLDSVRADHVGACGYERPTTPRLDALARDGVLFERAYAGSSHGGQSLSAFWTGRLPSSGGHTGLEATPHPALATLPRLLAREGFRTGLVSNQTSLRERAFTRGFDEIEVDSVEGRWSGEQVTAKGLELVDQAAGEPFFLAVVYGDAAEPHLPSAELRRRIDAPLPAELLSLASLREAAGELPRGIERSPGFLDLIARYDAEVAYVDDCLGKLVDGLGARGLLDETLLVVTASHGEEFLEHGYAGSGWTLYEEVLRVPLVVRAPHLLASQRIEEPVSLADLLPTLQTVFALAPGDRPLDGEPLLESDARGLSARATRGAVIAELVVPGLSILRASIARDRTLIDAVEWIAPEERLARTAGYDDFVERMQAGEVPRPDPWAAPVRRELYDLLSDPRQAHDLAVAGGDRLARLARLLEAYAELCRRSGLASKEPARRAAEEEDAEPADAGELRALGYM